MQSIPRVPWQITGNHWVTVPCIHPADASVHMIGAVHAGLRGAIEFAGSSEFLDGTAPALLRLTLAIDGEKQMLGGEGIAWERESSWIPAFSCKVKDLVVRGVICAPHGRNADLAGFVLDVSVENRGSVSLDVALGAEGSFGERMLRVKTSRAFSDASRVMTGINASVVLQGDGAENPVAIAIGASRLLEPVIRSPSSWSIGETQAIEAGSSHSMSICVAVGQERDGAEAVLEVMRRRGAANLIASTRAALVAMEPSTAIPAADRLIARHMFFAYFCSIARAIDDAHLYVMRSRVPWNGSGMTIRDWEALMWVMPAVQLADPPLGRELLLRICDLHGYAPGAGVHYLDGSLFEPGFSLEGASAFPIAVDEYIVSSGDDKIVEEPLLADSLYNAFDDIEARKHPTLPLYSTEVNADGSAPEFQYTAQGNAVVALALDILAHTLDEKTAEKVQDPAAVRAAVLRHFSDVGAGGKNVLARSTSLNEGAESFSSPSAAMYWLPLYDLLARDDSIYRRTVKPLETLENNELFLRCARLVGPNGSAALDWMRRAPLDGGVAAEFVDGDGRAIGNGGDAALSGLIAYTAWYAVHALGVAI